MVKLKIKEIDEYQYTLVDENNKEYKLLISFLKMDVELKIGDYLYMNKELLNPKYDGYSVSYTFGDLDSKYGKPNIELNDIDVIKLIIDKKEIFCKRLYG